MVLNPMIKYIFAVIALVCSVLFISACTDSSECLTADEIRLLKTLNFQGLTYTLYSRTTRLQEKEAFLELHGSEVKFDECGKSPVEPIDIAHIDLSQGVIENIVIKSNKINVVQNTTKSGNLNLEEINIEIQE